MLPLNKIGILKIIELTNKRKMNNPARGHIIYCRPLVFGVYEMTKRPDTETYEEWFQQTIAVNNDIYPEDVLDKLILKSIENNGCFNPRVMNRLMLTDMNGEELNLYKKRTHKTIDFSISVNTSGLDWYSSALCKNLNGYQFELHFFVEIDDEFLFRNMFFDAEYEEVEKIEIEKLMKSNSVFMPL
jgi:hypothetical protein